MKTKQKSRFDSAAQQPCELPSPRKGRYWVGGKCSLFLSRCFETAFSSRTPDLNSNEPAKPDGAGYGRWDERGYVSRSYGRWRAVFRLDGRPRLAVGISIGGSCDFGNIDNRFQRFQCFISITQIHTGSDQGIDVLQEWLEILGHVMPIGWTNQAFAKQHRQHEPGVVPAGVLRTVAIAWPM
jgi:hypothetical protein